MRLLLLPLLVLVALAGMACADDQETGVGWTERISMELSPGIHRHLFSLEAGSRLEFEFRSDSEVDFRLLDPGGRELESWEQVIHVDKQSYVAESAGQYKLELDNSATEAAPTDVIITMQVFPSDEN